MTEEKLLRANQIVVEIQRLEEKIKNIENLIVSGQTTSVRIETPYHSTLISEGEDWLLDELLDYRRNKLIALKKEFELL